MRDGSYEQMTIRRLAAELRVRPCRCRHVRDKDDPLDGIVAASCRSTSGTPRWPTLTLASRRPLFVGLLLDLRPCAVTASALAKLLRFGV